MFSKDCYCLYMYYNDNVLKVSRFENNLTKFMDSSLNLKQIFTLTNCMEPSGSWLVQVCILELSLTSTPVLKNFLRPLNWLLKDQSNICLHRALWALLLYKILNDMSTSVEYKLLLQFWFLKEYRTRFKHYLLSFASKIFSIFFLGTFPNFVGLLSLNVLRFAKVDRS